MELSQTKDVGGVVVVRAGGQLNVSNRHELKDLLLGALAAGDRKFVLDFTTTGYIDSSGMGALVSLAKRVREDGGDLRLAGLNDDLRHLFELTKLDTLFTIAATPQLAAAGF
jgi:anti-sigma B factor antagonist